MASRYSLSIVENIIDNSGRSCGYCKGIDNSIYKGIWARTMTVQDYQDLIDRGWRRSGQYCYKPSLSETCCPLYTIRCEALNFKLTKSQKKIIKKVGKYLKNGEMGKKEHSSNDSISRNESYPSDFIMKPQPDLSMGENFDLKFDASLESFVFESTSSLSEKSVETVGSSEVNCEVSKKLKTTRPGEGSDSSKPKCKKAKLIRLERKKKKLEEKGKSLELLNKKKIPQEKSLEDFIKEYSGENGVNKLELKLVRSHPRSGEFEETFMDEVALYQKYQTTIHNDSMEKCTPDQFSRFLVNSPLQVRLIPVTCRNELKESFTLFVKYQMGVHKESESECDLNSFESFLLDSPLQSMKASDSSSPAGYGSFHQQYWVNGQLIAVGVIDILPKCISSVYFFYDPDYSFLSLGTYGSLREIEYVRSLNRKCSNLSYYYMGYYIHSCPKMKYKASMSPSFLLCPEAYTWHPVAECQAKLDKIKYSRFNEDPEVTSREDHVQLSKVLVLWRQIAMPYSTYRNRRGREEESEEVLQYAQLVGKTCAERMLLCRH